MPYKNIEDAISNRKKYHQENKELLRIKHKQWREKNKEYLKEYDKAKWQRIKKEREEAKTKYYEENKEKIEQEKQKYQYDLLKRRKEKRWIKEAGMKIIDNVYDKWYECKNCELCDVEFLKTRGSQRKILDHDHYSGYPRFICCHVCNIKLGVVDNIKEKLHSELHRYYFRNL